MFGRRTTQYVDANITINRAPTDQSVALLREMEQKAEAEVIKAVHVESNGFECVVHAVRDMASDTMIWRAVFKLNGRQMTAKFEDYSIRALNPAHMATGLRDEMAKVIATEALTRIAELRIET